MRHVDDFIEDDSEHAYAREWFRLFRRPELVKMREPNPHKLFTSWGGERYRVTGCSRLGDVWLHSDFNEDTTYEHRVDVDECHSWSAEADQ